MGAASVDPLNLLGRGKPDLVPTRLVDTASMETASDDWLADLDDDGVSDLGMGRLPVATVAAADAAVQKILDYEAGRRSGRTREAIFAAGANDEFDFEAATAGAVARLDPGAAPSVIHLGDGSGTGGARLVEGLRRGAWLVNRFGHGSTEEWSSVLRSDGASQLASDGQYPVVLSMSCLNGFFHDVYTTSLAESLLAPAHGGAVAVWAATTLLAPDQQAILDAAAVELLPGRTLGEATRQAKLRVTDPDVRRAYVLFGDPLLVATPTPTATPTPGPVMATVGCSTGATQATSALPGLPGLVVLFAGALLRRRHG